MAGTGTALTDEVMDAVLAAVVRRFVKSSGSIVP